MYVSLHNSEEETLRAVHLSAAMEFYPRFSLLFMHSCFLKDHCLFCFLKCRLLSYIDIPAYSSPFTAFGLQGQCDENLGYIVWIEEDGVGAN